MTMSANTTKLAKMMKMNLTTQVVGDRYKKRKKKLLTHVYYTTNDTGRWDELRTHTTHTTPRNRYYCTTFISLHNFHLIVTHFLYMDLYFS